MSSRTHFYLINDIPLDLLCVAKFDYSDKNCHTPDHKFLGPLMKDRTDKGYQNITFTNKDFEIEYIYAFLFPLSKFALCYRTALK